jgi:hypothetical protein
MGLGKTSVQNFTEEFRYPGGGGELAQQTLSKLY